MTSFLFGQDKYGHLNFGNLISEMPETTAANADLETYQQELITAGEEMAAAFQKDYEAFAIAVQKGLLKPVEQAEQEQALQAKQQQILAYEQEIGQLLEAKRAELLTPIVDRAQEVVREVAKENGFVMVFDTSIFGAVLFSDESEDLWELVTAKLGLE